MYAYLPKKRCHILQWNVPIHVHSHKQEHATVSKQNSLRKKKHGIPNCLDEDGSLTNLAPGDLMRRPRKGCMTTKIQTVTHYSISVVNIFNHCSMMVTTMSNILSINDIDSHILFYHHSLTNASIFLVASPLVADKRTNPTNILPPTHLWLTLR